MNLSDYSLLQISGTDAAKFLQGQLTCDIEQINPELSSLGAHCNAKGRIMSFFRLFLRNDSYYLLMPTEVIADALIALKKYALFSKVKLDIIQANCFAVQTITKDLLLPTVDNTVINDDSITYIRIRGKTPRYFIIDFAKTMKLKSMDTTQWHQLDIIAGIPRLYPNTIGAFLPHYLNLPALGAVSFQKGCYTGQEIIARMQHRGKLKQHMVIRYLQTTKSLVPGTKCLDINQKNIGQIIDTVANDAQQLCLLLLQDQAYNESEIIVDEEKIKMTPV